MNLYGNERRRPDAAEEQTSVVFTVDELWLLQSVVRHEVAQARQWDFPPASLALNDAVAAAILFCLQHQQPEAALRLSRGDLLVLDYVVPAGAKDAAGKPLGKQILLKSFEARARLAESYPYAEVEGNSLSKAATLARLKEHYDA